MAGVGEVGVDADPAGNEAARLGSIQNCIDVSIGDTFDVDVYVKDIDDLIAFSAWLQYDPAVVEVTERDTLQILTTADGANVQDFSDPTPDSDGRYDLNAANLSETSGGASGNGVLARVTLTAVGAGISDLNLQSEDIDGDGEADRGVYLKDVDATNVGDNDGDTLYDGALRNGAVAVDDDCGNADPQVIGDDGGSSVLWVVMGVVAALIVVIGLGGLILRRRRAGDSSSAN